MLLNFESFIGTEKIKTLINGMHRDYLLRVFNDADAIDKQHLKKIVRIAYVYMSYCVASLEQGTSTEQLKDKLHESYYLMRTINIEDAAQREKFSEIFATDMLGGHDLYYFYLAAFGLLSQNSIKIRLDLKAYDYDTNRLDRMEWGERVLNYCLAALVLLVRKQDGMEDIRFAISAIEKLRLEQAKFEEEYMSKISIGSRVNKAYNLLGFYHLTKIIVETGKYLAEGYMYQGNLQVEIKRHAQLARESLADLPRLQDLVSIFEACVRQLQLNSIWYKTDGLSSHIEKFCKTLAENQILELLPSQQDALNQSLLDAVSNVAVVQMPTSAGKTLLAEFSILQTLALKADAKIVYVVPTRALLNQITSDLKKDLGIFNFTIEKTSKVNELDPSEDLFLQQNINILVATSEKLDLLIRKKHPSVEDISLVVVDEAHNIKDGERGARLELLLSIIKRERPKAKFLLLSPFIPNASKLSQWLAGGKKAIAPIKILWKPADKLFIGLREKRSKFLVETLPSAHNLETIKEHYEIPIEESENLVESSKKQRIFEFTARHFSKTDKSILYLCKGRGTADKQAAKLLEYFPRQKTSEMQDLVSRYIEDEIGKPSIYSEVIKSGIVIHHAGLTEDTKQLIEGLIRIGEIKHICATSTVAQGINFPISTVYIDSLSMGSHPMSVSEFLNVAGRAGRTLVDNIGKIIFPFNTVKNRALAQKYLREEAGEVTSALVELLARAEEITAAFSDINNPRQRAVLYGNNQALRSLVQYLIHVLSVAEEEQYANDLGELFKDSFGYFLLDERNREKFVKICQALYLDLQRRNKGVLRSADKTGFSVPSILKIMHANTENPAIADPTSWNPTYLFQEGNNYLTEKISVIGQLREVQLGTDSRNAAFNPELVAQILKQWVNGEKLYSMSKSHPHFVEKDGEGKINDFVKYLTGATFKSSWGLSALEGIVKSKDEDIVSNSHIPSMVYYGVKSSSAVAMRMVGVPRGIAEGVSNIVFSGGQKNSFDSLRKTIRSMNDASWDAVTPRNSSLNGKEWKQITRMLVD